MINLMGQEPTVSRINPTIKANSKKASLMGGGNSLIPSMNSWYRVNSTQEKRREDAKYNMETAVFMRDQWKKDLDSVKGRLLLEEAAPSARLKDGSSMMKCKAKVS
jgi:hypothetical protein